MKKRIMNDRKYKTVVTYACFKACEAGEPLNRSKLYKVVWLSDLRNYFQKGQTITGDKMVKAPHGPITREIKRIVGESVAEGMIQENQVLSGLNDEYNYFCGELPDVDRCLTASEVSSIDSALNQIMPLTASEVSKLTHRFDAWKNHDEWEEIHPIEFSVQKRTPTPEDLKWAEEQIHGFG